MSIWEDVAGDVYAYENMRDHNENRPKYARHNWLWRTGTGKAILVKEMDDVHLYNAFMSSKDDRLFTEMVIRLFEKRLEVEAEE